MPTKQDALDKARSLSKQTKRKYVVRENYGDFFAVPLYKIGSEGYEADPGYSGLGVLVKESL